MFLFSFHDVFSFRFGNEIVGFLARRTVGATMASFDEVLDTFMRQSMSSARPRNDFSDVLAHASFETMASEAVDVAIASQWPDDELLLADGRGELLDRGEEAALGEEEGELLVGEEDGELLVGEEEEGEGEEDAIEREIQEDLLRELPSAKLPLRSAMRQRRRDDDDDGDVGEAAEAKDDDEEEDDLTLPSDDDEEEEPVARKPLLPEFHGEFSSSDDSQLLSLGDLDEDDETSDDDGDAWLTARDYEPDDDDGVAAAVKKKKKSPAAAKPPTSAAAGSKRKRAADDEGDGDTKKAARKALLEYKSRHSKMSSDEQLEVVRAYVKVAAVDHIMRAEHTESGAPADDYKSFRALVLEEAAAGAADDDIKQLAHAIVAIEADITDTIAATKRAEPEPMQLLIDFVTGTTALAINKEAVPASAARCDVTLQPSAPAKLVLVTATLASGAERRLVMRASIQHLAQNLWTLANFYHLVGTRVAKALATLKRLSTAEALASLDANTDLLTRISKLLGEAHSKTCWHARVKLSEK